MKFAHLMMISVSQETIVQAWRKLWVAWLSGAVGLSVTIRCMTSGGASLPAIWRGRYAVVLASPTAPGDCCCGRKPLSIAAIITKTAIFVRVIVSMAFLPKMFLSWIVVC